MLLTEQRQSKINRAFGVIVVALLVLVCCQATGAQPWQRVPGPPARDVTFGGNLPFVNIVGADGQLYRWIDSNQAPLPTNPVTQFEHVPFPDVALRMDVTPQGEPWVITTGGAIYTPAPTPGFWTWVTGAAANDVASGTFEGNSPVFIVSRVSAGADFQIYRWNGSGWDYEGVDGIAVAVDGEQGLWVVNAAGEIRRRVRGEWRTIPGRARDIANGTYGGIAIIGMDDAGGGNSSAYRWTGTEFERLPGGAGVRIAMEGFKFYIVNTAGEIYRYYRSLGEPGPEVPPAIELWENVGRTGRRVAVTNSGNVWRGGVEFSSLRVNTSGWVIFYSQRDSRGSELRIKGPYTIDDLSTIVKKNGPCIGGATTGPPGNWDDEIESVQIVSGNFDPDGCGTNCPGPGYCGPIRGLAREGGGYFRLERGRVIVGPSRANRRGRQRTKRARRTGLRRMKRI